MPARMSASATVLPEMATHQQTRTCDQQLVLRALHDHDPLARADLTRLTDLTRTSVGDRRATIANRGARRVRGGSDRAPPHRFAEREEMGER
jgi:hypothetical protein